MTTTPDLPNFRAHCAELLFAIQLYTGQNPAASEMSCVEVTEKLMNAMAATTAALDTPPPEPPTDEELEKVADHYMVMDGATGSMSLEHLHFARAVLERWGNQATITQTHND